MEHEMELPRSPHAPSLARRALTQWYGGNLESEELHRVKLLASELVTNAVVHGDGAIHLRADLDEDRIIVEVLDQGSGFEHDVREVPFDELRGRGLGIVDAASSRWGIHEGTTHVWFELERAGPRVGVAKKPEV
jgi:anti-sigma regulatory factor (Ser/Thr protein kinase)